MPRKQKNQTKAFPKEENRLKHFKGKKQNISKGKKIKHFQRKQTKNNKTKTFPKEIKKQDKKYPASAAVCMQKLQTYVKLAS